MGLILISFLIMEMNKIFRDANNNVFNRVNAAEIAACEGNFISVVSKAHYQALLKGEDFPQEVIASKEDKKTEAICRLDGEFVAMPKVLYNEIGVDYHFVSYKEHGLKMAKKHGVFTAVKQESIRVWKNVKPGEKLQSVIDGFVEHEVVLEEGFFAAQNILKGEFYGISAAVLEEKYEFVESQFDFDVYKPKADAVSQWVYSDSNVYGVLWGGLEFLTTPMINITNENDVYGCNYQVFWGWDGKLASYKVLGYFRGCGTQFYEGYSGEPKKVSMTTFQPPRVLVDVVC